METSMENDNIVEKKPSEILAGAIQLLDGGDAWIKDEITDGHGRYCLLGAVSRSYYGETEFDRLWCEDPIKRLYPRDSNVPALQHVNDLIRQATGGEEGFEVNDHEDTEFPDVHAVLCKATKLALEEEEKDAS